MLVIWNLFGSLNTSYIFPQFEWISSRWERKKCPPSPFFQPWQFQKSKIVMVHWTLHHLSNLAKINFCVLKIFRGMASEKNIYMYSVHVYVYNIFPFFKFAVMTSDHGHWEGNLTHICYVDEINQTHAFGWCAPTDPCSQVIIIFYFIGIVISSAGSSLRYSC